MPLGGELLLAGVGVLLLVIFVIGFMVMWFSGRGGE